MNRFNTSRPLLQYCGFPMPFRCSVERREVVQDRRHIRMVRPQRLPDYRQRTLIERLGHRVLALGSVEQRQVVQARRHIGMVWADAFLGYSRAFLATMTARPYWPLAYRSTAS